MRQRSGRGKSPPDFIDDDIIIVFIIVVEIVIESVVGIGCIASASLAQYIMVSTQNSAQIHLLRIKIRFKAFLHQPLREIHSGLLLLLAPPDICSILSLDYYLPVPFLIQIQPGLDQPPYHGKKRGFMDPGIDLMGLAVLQYGVEKDTFVLIVQDGKGASHVEIDHDTGFVTHKMLPPWFYFHYHSNTNVL